MEMGTSYGESGNVQVVENTMVNLVADAAEPILHAT